MKEAGEERKSCWTEEKGERKAKESSVKRKKRLWLLLLDGEDAASGSKVKGRERASFHLTGP